MTHARKETSEVCATNASSATITTCVLLVLRTVLSLLVTPPTTPCSAYSLAQTTVSPLRKPYCCKFADISTCKTLIRYRLVLWWRSCSVRPTTSVHMSLLFETRSHGVDAAGARAGWTCWHHKRSCAYPSMKFYLVLVLTALWPDFCNLSGLSHLCGITRRWSESRDRWFCIASVAGASCHESIRGSHGFASRATHATRSARHRTLTSFQHGLSLAVFRRKCATKRLIRNATNCSWFNGSYCWYEPEICCLNSVSIKLFSIISILSLFFYRTFVSAYDGAESRSASAERVVTTAAVGNAASVNKVYVRNLRVQYSVSLYCTFM